MGRQPYGVQDTSSGEYHLLISLLGIFARIKPNSLILIDEPETSLHPNWQMRYIDELKRIFKKYSDSHFILASHSHFIVSDLENSSSSVLALTKNADQQNVTAKLLDAQTYGWSAEEVLYDVFNVRSSRNYYLEYDLNKVIALVNQNSDQYDEIRKINEKLETLSLTEADPLNVIIQKIKNYLQNV